MSEKKRPSLGRQLAQHMLSVNGQDKALKSAPREPQADSPDSPMRQVIRDEVRKIVRAELCMGSGLKPEDESDNRIATPVQETIRDEARRALRIQLGAEPPSAEVPADTPMRSVIREEVEKAVSAELGSDALVPEDDKPGTRKSTFVKNGGRRRTMVLAAGVGAVGIAATSFFGKDEPYQAPMADSDVAYTQTAPISPLMVVAAATVGAADGMKSVGWKNPGMEARVREVGKNVPTSVSDPAFSSTDRRLVGALISARAFAKQDAMSGAWTEEALEGYLQVAEMTMDEYVTASRPFLKDGSGMGINTVVKYGDIARQMGDSVFLSSVPEGKYATLALAKAVAFENGVIHSLTPLLTERGTKPLPEMEEVRRIAFESGQQDVEAVSRMVNSAGFGFSLKMSMSNSGLQKVSIFPDPPKPLDEDDGPSPL